MSAWAYRERNGETCRDVCLSPWCARSQKTGSDVSPCLYVFEAGSLCCLLLHGYARPADWELPGILLSPSPLPLKEALRLEASTTVSGFRYDEGSRGLKFRSSAYTSNTSPPSYVCNPRISLLTSQETSSHQTPSLSCSWTSQPPLL